MTSKIWYVCMSVCFSVKLCESYELTFIKRNEQSGVSIINSFINDTYEAIMKHYINGCSCLAY